jgi:VWFA-related protein
MALTASRLALLPLASALLVADTGRAQQPPRFGASAELVVIDMIATDDDGQPVVDLRAEEIEIQEGGKPQKVEFARFVTAGDGPPGTRTAVAAAEAGPGQTAPATAGPSTTQPDPPTDGGPQPAATTPLSLVVVVDLATLPFDLLAHTREAVAAMVQNQLEPGTRLMLVTLDRGLQVRQGFTDDPGRFAAAVQALTPSAGEGDAGLERLVDDLADACQRLEGGAPDASPAGLQNALSLARSWVENARLGMTASLEGMGALSRYLAVRPGRKHVVYYSAGYPMDPSASTLGLMEAICTGGTQRSRSELQTSVRSTMQVDSTGMLRALVDEANRAQVSIYTVDARGLTGSIVSARSAVPVRGGVRAAAQQAAHRHVTATQEILHLIADGTGGRASVNTNDLQRGMQAAAKDARGYYLVAYAPPPGRKEGKYYPIEVKLKRPGLKARYRRGYEWLSEAKRSERALAAALRFPGLYAEDGLALDPWIEAGKLNVAVILPVRSLVFRDEAGLHRNELTLQGLLRDDKGRMVGDRYLFT